MTSQNSPYAVELRNLSKAFGHCIANEGISLSVEKGTIHGIVGENGAGKSTAMKMLFGLYSPDQGEIWIHGKKRVWRSSKDASDAGIGMVHQHFMLAPTLSTLDNAIVGVEPVKKFWRYLPRFLQPIDRRTAKARMESLAKDSGFTLDTNAAIGSLSVGIQQRVEILKVLYRQAEIIILDEPTAVLTPQEIEELFASLKKMVAEGKTILLITHKLKEVLSIADAITVFRQGRVVHSLTAKGTSEAKLAELMVGRQVQLHATPPTTTPETRGNKPMVSVNKLTIQPKRGAPILDQVSMDIFPGEIVGIAGVEGNGQTEFFHMLADPLGTKAKHAKLTYTTTGSIAVDGVNCFNFNNKKIRNLGVGIVPADRLKEAIVGSMTVSENYILGSEESSDFSKMGWLRKEHIQQATMTALDKYDVRPREGKINIQDLSGGNQQKLVIAREFHNQLKVILAAHPTRGVDVGSIEFIHTQLLKAREQGTAILLVSSELSEIMDLSDRIFVFFKGSIAAAFKRGEKSATQIGQYMGGHRD